jgi:hypothetical protein
MPTFSAAIYAVAVYALTKNSDYYHQTAPPSLRAEQHKSKPTHKAEGYSSFQLAELKLFYY